MKTRSCFLLAVLLGTTLGALASPWSALPRSSATPDWICSPSFGWICDAYAPHLYHLEHGWLYVIGDDETSLWFYDHELGHWWWTGSAVYQRDGARWSYHAKARVWLDYEGSQGGDRWWHDPAGTRVDAATVSAYGVYVAAMRRAGLDPFPLAEFKEAYLDPRRAGRAMNP